MERCTCDDSPDLENRKAWQWGVCGDNLKYSTKFLKKFLGQKRIGKDLRAKVDIHNTNVGIKVRSCISRPRKKLGLNASLLTKAVCERGVHCPYSQTRPVYLCVVDLMVLSAPWKDS